MTKSLSASVRILRGLAAALPAVFGILSAGPAFGSSPASPPLAMEEVEVYGSGELPERLLAPAPVPIHAAIPVHADFLRERILAPISSWENDDEDLRAGVDGFLRDGRD